MGRVVVPLETKGYFYISKYGAKHTACFIPEYEYMAEHHYSKQGLRYGTYQEFKKLFPYRIDADRHRSQKPHYFGRKL